MKKLGISIPSDFSDLNDYQDRISILYEALPFYAAKRMRKKLQGNLLAFDESIDQFVEIVTKRSA